MFNKRSTCLFVTVDLRILRYNKEITEQRVTFPSWLTSLRLLDTFVFLKLMLRGETNTCVGPAPCAPARLCLNVRGVAWQMKAEAKPTGDPPGDQTR